MPTITPRCSPPAWGLWQVAQVIRPSRSSGKSFGILMLFFSTTSGVRHAGVVVVRRVRVVVVAADAQQDDVALELDRLVLAALLAVRLRGVAELAPLALVDVRVRVDRAELLLLVAVPAHRVAGLVGRAAQEGRVLRVERRGVAAGVAGQAGQPAVLAAASPSGCARGTFRSTFLRSGGRSPWRGPTRGSGCTARSCRSSRSGISASFCAPGSPLRALRPHGVAGLAEGLHEVRPHARGLQRERDELLAQELLLAGAAVRVVAGDAGVLAACTSGRFAG